MIPIEKYAQAAASTARTPPNSPARRAALEAENAARVAAEQFVKGLEAERDELRARLDASKADAAAAWVRYENANRLQVSLQMERAEMRAKYDELLFTRPAQAVPDGWRLVNAGALAMVVNALRRDAEDGRPVRGEMADELIAAAPEHKA